MPLAQYNAYMRACMAARPFVERERLSNGFQAPDRQPAMLDQLGPAVNSGKSLFLYGAPGNGKTVVAEGIGRALGDEHAHSARAWTWTARPSRCSTP